MRASSTSRCAEVSSASRPRSSDWVTGVAIVVEGHRPGGRRPGACPANAARGGVPRRRAAAPGGPCRSRSWAARRRSRRSAGTCRARSRALTCSWSSRASAGDGRVPVAQHDHRAHDRAALLVGGGHHGGLGHRRMRDQRRLDLERADAVAGGDDHVVGAALEVAGSRPRRARTRSPVCQGRRRRRPRPGSPGRTSGRWPGRRARARRRARERHARQRPAHRARARPARPAASPVSWPVSVWP